MIRKIWKKDKSNSEMPGKYGRKASRIVIRNGQYRKKSKSNSETIGKIWRKGKSNSEKIWKI
jgi:hypothetical protein